MTDGKEVPLRLTEPMRAGGVLIPANTVLTGTARIDGERMMITVNAVQYRGSVIPVELLVYDMDGGEGISVPSSDEISAVKEMPPMRVQDWEAASPLRTMRERNCSPIWGAASYKARRSTSGRRCGRSR